MCIVIIFLWHCLLYSPVQCRYIVPPILDSGHSDLFPGPGAGMYPTRFVALFALSIQCLHLMRSEFHTPLFPDCQGGLLYFCSCLIAGVILVVEAI